MPDYSFSGGIVRGLGRGDATIGSRHVVYLATPGAGISGAPLGLPGIATALPSFPYVAGARAVLGTAMPAFVTIPDAKAGLLFEAMALWAQPLNLGGAATAVTLNGHSVRLRDPNRGGVPVLELAAASEYASSNGMTTITSRAAGVLYPQYNLAAVSYPQLLDIEDLGAGATFPLALDLELAFDVTPGGGNGTFELIAKLTFWNVNGVHLDG